MAKKLAKKPVKKVAKKAAAKTVKTQKVSVKAVETPVAKKAPTVKIWKYEFDRKNVIAAGVIALVVLLCLVF